MWNLLVSTGFFIGWYYIYYRLHFYGISPQKILWFGIIVSISAYIGSKLFFIAYNYPQIKKGELRISLRRGAVYYGALIFSIVSGWIYLVYYQLPVGLIGDYAAQALAFGMFLGRIGCFLNGCCFGKPSKLPWAVKYPEDSLPAKVFGTTRVHPSQLYESFANLALVLFLFYLEKVRPFEGFVFLSYLFLSAFIRFMVDFTRYYEHYKIKLLSINQWIALIIMGLSLMMILYCG